MTFTGFVALSVFAHIAAFFIFQVTYPAHVTIPPPAAQLTVLSADIPEHRSLLAWLAAEDPALAGGVSKAKPPGFATLPYKASFDIVRTWPRRAPAAYDTVPMPAGQSGLEFIQNATKPPASEPNRRATIGTSIQVSGPLAARGMTGNFSPDARSSTALTPSRFMLGVDAEGRVRHVFLQNSSGVAAVDESAARAVKALTFEPAKDAITWGFVSVTWGDEALVTLGSENPSPLSKP